MLPPVVVHFNDAEEEQDDVPMDTAYQPTVEDVPGEESEQAVRQYMDEQKAVASPGPIWRH